MKSARVIMEIGIDLPFIKLEPATVTDQDIFSAELSHDLPFSSNRNVAYVDLIEPPSGKTSTDESNLQLLSSSGHLVRIKCEPVDIYGDGDSPTYVSTQTGTFHKTFSPCQETDRSSHRKSLIGQRETQHLLSIETAPQQSPSLASPAFPTALFRNVYIKTESVDSAYTTNYQTESSGSQYRRKFGQSVKCVASPDDLEATYNPHEQNSTIDSQSCTRPMVPAPSHQQSAPFVGGKLKSCFIKLERIPSEVAKRGFLHLPQQHEKSFSLRQPSSMSAVTAVHVSLAAIKPRSREGDRPYKCEQCGLSYKTASARSQHRKVHTGIKEHTCKLCGTSFLYKSSLTAHLRTHTDERPYKCPLCDHAFRWSSHLKTHLVIHSGEKPYKCHICGARYTQNGNLQIHILSHTGQKNFVCDVCNKAFLQLTHLQSHSRVHTGERPYKCNQCDAAFSHSSTLTIHKRTHTGEKPYKCLKCASAFAQLPHLKMHMKVHNGPKKESKVHQGHRRMRIQLALSSAAK